MRVLRTMRAIAGALLLSPGLSLAADQEPPAPNLQATPSQAASGMSPAMMPPMQPWPQTMPFPGVPPYYWAPPPGMMWPMPSPYPAPMAMPSMPPVPWVPVMWVMVPMPAEIPGMGETQPAPAANTPDVKSPPSNSTAPMPGSDAMPSSGAGEDKGISASTTIPGSPESTMPPSIAPVQEKAVYVLVAPTPVVKLPVPDAAPSTPAESTTPAAGGADAGKVIPGQAADPIEVAAPSPDSSVATLAGEADSATHAPLDASLKIVTVDYGPVAPTPVVDLLVLMQPDKPAVKTPARSKKPRKSSVAIPLKSRPTPAAKPVKQRMCWTRGVVAPCR